MPRKANENLTFESIEDGLEERQSENLVELLSGIYRDMFGDNECIVTQIKSLTEDSNILTDGQQIAQEEAAITKEMEIRDERGTSEETSAAMKEGYYEEEAVDRMNGRKRKNGTASVINDERRRVCRQIIEMINHM